MAIEEQKQARTGQHFYELDSLRGLAAVSVVLWHFSLAYQHPFIHLPFTPSWWTLSFHGGQAVDLFFVLSGFVLTLPGLRGRQSPYPVFLLKRVLRIYVPYLGALGLALAGDALLHGPTRAGSNWMDAWVNDTWTAPISPKLLAEHLTMIGNYPWAQINTAFWSLVIEMRVSIIFPVLLWLVLRLRARWVILIATALTFAGKPLALLCQHFLAYEPFAFYPSKTFQTLYWAAMFLLGALLARHMDNVGTIAERIGQKFLWVVFALAVVLWDGQVPTFLMRRSLPIAVTKLLFHDSYESLAPLAGCLLLLVLALHLKGFSRLLRVWGVHHLGKVSYSLYLVHGTVLFAVLHLLPADAPLWMRLTPYLGITAGLTEIFYRVVEVKAIAWSKQVGARARLVKQEVAG